MRPGEVRVRYDLFGEKCTHSAFADKVRPSMSCPSVKVLRTKYEELANVRLREA